MSRIEVLRQYETVGYQIAYYLLEDEALAAESALEALIELFKNDEFFCQPHMMQQRTAKNVFIRQSLKTKQLSC